MGGAGVFGDIKRADRGVWGAPCASCKINRRASAGCSDDLGLVPAGSPGRKARGVARPYAFDEDLGKLVHLVTPGWQDAKLIAFDQWLTGVNPSLWLERLAHPALNEFMQFAYFTYFLFLLNLGGILYYRRDLKSYWAVMTYSAVAYVSGYVISMFFPVQSPWFTFAGMRHGDLAGGPFTGLINLIEKCGRVHGAAFPSQHVAGAVAALWGAWRHRRWLFWVFLPFVLCMCVSTVYVRNHYVADVLGGMVTGTLGYVIGGWVMKTRGAVATTAR